MTERTMNEVEANLPYPPSWIDRFTGWVDRLPVPWWAFYAGAAVLAEAIQIFVLAKEGIFAAYGPRFFQFFFPVNFVLAAFLMHAFDRQALTALERFRPALRSDALPYKQLLYELTTLPARPALAAGLAGLAFGALSVVGTGSSLAEYPMDGMNTTPAALRLVMLFFILTLWFWFTLIFHSIYQLRQVHRIYTRYTQVDLYQLQPYYGLAGLAAVTALGAAVYTYPWLADPGLQGGSAPGMLAGILLTLPFYAWPILVFILPLWGAHRILVERKAQAQADVGRRRHALLERFHHSLEQENLSGIDGLNKALATLELEAAGLEKVPTWPWPRGMFRNLLGAFLLPVLIWLIQFVLGRLLG
jgi:hypothetical protein